jgi:two-component system response regulator AtoC
VSRLNDADQKPVRPVTDRRPTPLKEISRRAAQAAEREAIRQTLEQTRWNRVRAAKLLSISYRALLYKIKDAGFDQDRRVGQP